VESSDLSPVRPTLTNKSKSKSKLRVESNSDPPNKRKAKKLKNISSKKRLEIDVSDMEDDEDEKGGAHLQPPSSSRPSLVDVNKTKSKSKGLVKKLKKAASSKGKMGSVDVGGDVVDEEQVTPTSRPSLSKTNPKSVNISKRDGLCLRANGE